MKTNKNLNYIFLLAIVILGILAIPHLNNIEKMNDGGTLLGISNAKLNDNNYWVVSFAQSTFADEGMFTEKKSDTVYTTKDGKDVKVDFNAEFGIDIDKTGWMIPLEEKYTTKSFANSIKDTHSSWYQTSTNLEYKFDTSNHKYYEPVSNSWNIYRKYDSFVTVNGKTFKKTTEFKTEDGFRQVIYESENGLRPIIYEEAMISMEAGTSGFPIMTKVQVIPYQNEKSMIFIDTSKQLYKIDKNGIYCNPNSGISTTINNIIQDNENNVDSAISWNDVIGGKQFAYGMFGKQLGYYIDINNDGKIDSDGINKQFTWDQFVTESSMRVKYSNGVTSMISVPNPKNFEYSPKPAYNNYELITSGNYKNSLLYKTPLKIVGTWQIPIEYGTISVIEKDPTFEIISKSISSDIIDNYGEAKYIVDIKCTSGEGKARVELIKDDLSVQIQIKEPTFQTINLKEGESQKVEFTIVGNNVDKNTEGSFKIKLMGGLTNIEERGEYKLINADGINKEDMISIKVNAVSSKGDYLDGQSISINGDEQFGTWEGQVAKGISLTITGKFHNGYTPKEIMTITPTTDGQTFNFIYTSTDANTSNDYTLFIIISIIIILLGIFSYIAYYYTSNNKKRGNKK